MARNYLRITHQDSSVRLSWQRAQTQPRFADPISFHHPFDRDALDELRWYLEDFLKFPYGIEPDKAKKTEDRLQQWGMGIVAEEQRRFEEAEALYRQALQIYEAAGDTYHAAGDYHQLGRVAQLQRRFEEAMSYFVQALGTYIRFEDGYMAEYPLRGLAELHQELGEAAFESTWEQVTGEPLSDEIRELI